MAAVVAATALKGRGARNARVLRGKKRDPGEGRVAGDPPLFYIQPGYSRRSRLSIPVRTPLRGKELGAVKWSLQVTPLPTACTHLRVLAARGSPTEAFRAPALQVSDTHRSAEGSPGLWRLGF